MSVEFDADQHQKSILYAKLLQPAEETPGLINQLTKYGIAKSPEAANRILITVMVISFVMTAYTVYNSSTSSAPTLNAEERAIQEERANLVKKMR